MRLKRSALTTLAILAGTLFLSGSRLQAFEYSAPIRWNVRGWMLKFFPHDEQFFLDGGLVATVDAMTAKGERLDWSIYAGAGLYAGMGYQEDGAVVFDPYDAHYSLIAGARFERGGWMADIEYLHDCFHDVDREDGSTEIWNVVKTDLCSRDWYPRYRRHKWSASKGSGFLIDAAWLATFWYFPNWKVHEYVQHMHDFSLALGGGLKLAFAHRKALAIELRPNILYFLDHGGGWTWKNDLLLYISWYGSDGTVCLFTGPRWDTQHIKPSGDRWLLGFDFYL
jgi:hypothetical protein